MKSGKREQVKIGCSSLGYLAEVDSYTTADNNRAYRILKYLYKRPANVCVFMPSSLLD